MTPHPGTVKCEVPITLARPRDPLSLAFINYQKELLRQLSHEAGVPQAGGNVARPPELGSNNQCQSEEEKR
jgi:hypothetical protein